MCTHWPDPAPERCEKKQATEFDSVSQIQLTTLLYDLHRMQSCIPQRSTNRSLVPMQLRLFSALLVYLQNNRKEPTKLSILPVVMNLLKKSHLYRFFFFIPGLFVALIVSYEHKMSTDVHLRCRSEYIQIPTKENIVFSHIVVESI